METHQILNGKVQLYRRGESRIWQCAGSVGGKQRRVSTKRESLALAPQFAEDWYLEMGGKDNAGILLSYEKASRKPQSNAFVNMKS